MYLTIAIITLQVLPIMLQGLWNIIYYVFSSRHAALAHLLSWLWLPASSLRYSSAVGLRYLECMSSSLWSISLIVLVVLVSGHNLRYWTLTSALLDWLIFGRAAVQLLDWSVLLEWSDVLSLSLSGLAGMGWSDAWCWSTFVWDYLARRVQAVLVGQARCCLQSVLWAVLLLVIHYVSHVLNLSSK